MKLRFVHLLLLAALALGATGCQSDDDPRVSERPWTRTQGWENGLPQEMFEGR